MTSNFDLKEQIRDYWSTRSETFDASFSHDVSVGVELQAWCDFYVRLYGSEEKHILDLGCGTGEVSKIQFALGHRVTGLDFSDAMLAKARAKHADKGSRANYVSGDAEATNLPDDTFDAATCRHLVWTLLKPQEALSDWFRVLKPGGHLVIFDGNFAQKSRKDRFLQFIIRHLSPPDEPTASSRALQEQNDIIRAGLPFRDGLTFEHLETLAENAGFAAIKRHSYTPIRRAQRRVAGPADWLRTFTTDRYVLHARKPK